MPRLSLDAGLKGLPFIFTSPKNHHAAASAMPPVKMSVDMLVISPKRRLAAMSDESIGMGLNSHEQVGDGSDGALISKVGCGRATAGFYFES